MFKVLLGFVASVLVSVGISLPAMAAHGGGGDSVNNGGGLAEKNFTYAFENLYYFIDYCLAINPCALTEKEDRILRQINAGITIYKQKGSLIFKSGTKEPGFFEVDEHGKTRVAVTSSTPGSPIYINLDMIYLGTGAEQKSMTVHEAVAILVHEYGHHYQVTDHLWLDKLGAKIQASREQYLQNINLQKMKQEKFALKAYNWSFAIKEYSSISQELLGRLVLENGYELVDLTPEVLKLLTCPAGTVVNGVFFSNMHWKRLAPADEARGVQVISASMDFDYQCHPPVGLGRVMFAKTLDFTADFKPKMIGSSGLLTDANFKLHEWVYFDFAVLSPVLDSIKLEIRD